MLFDLPSQQMICHPLCDQLILTMIESTVQLVGTRVELVPESLMPFPCLMAALARALCPPFHIGQSFFQGGAPLAHLRVLDEGLGKTMIGVQARWKQEILDDILLNGPEPGVALRNFYCIKVRGQWSRWE